MTFIVSEMKPEDAPLVAQVHVQAWQESYAGIVNAETLNSLSVSKRTLEWHTILESNPRDIFLKVEDDGAIIGFATASPCRDELPPLKATRYVGEVCAIYILERYKGQGVGFVLWNALREELSAKDLVPFYAWVIEANKAARNFYQRQGGILLPVSQDHVLNGQMIAEVCYGFPETRI